MRFVILAFPGNVHVYFLRFENLFDKADRYILGLVEVHKSTEIVITLLGKRKLIALLYISL